MAAEVAGWGTASNGERVALAWNQYSDEPDSYEVLPDRRGPYQLVGFGNIHEDGFDGLIAIEYRRRPGPPPKAAVEDSGMATAVHEAAHAVAAEVLGFHLRTVRLDDDDSGLTEHETPEDASFEELIILGAGEVAGCRYRGDDSPRGNTDDFLLALQVARELASGQGPTQAPELRSTKLLERAETGAKRLVEEHWAAIMAVAEEPSVRGTLQPEEVRLLMQQASSREN